MNSSDSTTFRTIPHGSGKILCVADIRGDYKRLNDMIKETGAVAVIHTGDWGFLDSNSPSRMSPRVLRHTLQYTPLIPDAARPTYLAHPHGPSLFSLLAPPSSPFVLSQLSLLLSGDLVLAAPCYVVYGPTEDIRVLEKFRTNEYMVNNLEILDEAVTRVLEIGGIRLRLLGLGGSVQLSKIFDNGEGTGTIAGGQGMVWATALQIGELVDTANRYFDPSETRILVSHGSVGREGLLAQLSMVLKADLTISGSLHFRYVTSFNEFNVQADAEMYKEKLAKSKKAFMDVYESAKAQLDSVIQPDQREYLSKALSVAQTIPNIGPGAEDDAVWKNIWHWNLTEAAYGDLVLVIKDGRVSAETRSSGFHFGYRRQKGKAQAQAPAITNAAHVNAPPQMHPGPKAAINAHARPPQPIAKPVPAPGPVAKPVSAPAPVVTVPQGAPLPKSTNAVPHPSVPAGNAVKSGPVAGNAARKPNGTVPNGNTRTENKTPALASAAAPASKDVSTDDKDSSTTTKKGKGREREKQGGKPEGPAANASGTEATSDAAAKPQQKDKKQQQKNKEEKPQPLQPSADTNEVVPSGSTDVDVAAVDADIGDAPKSADAAANGVTPHVFDPSLFLKQLPENVTEDEIRGLFEDDVKAKISKIKIKTASIPFAGGVRRQFAYVEFPTEEDVQEALEKHTNDIRGTTVSVQVSTPQAPRPDRFGGFSRGRGGGYSNRGGPARGGGAPRGGRGGFGNKTGGDAAKATPPPVAAPAPAPAPAAAAGGSGGGGW